MAGVWVLRFICIAAITMPLASSAGVLEQLVRGQIVPETDVDKGMQDQKNASFIAMMQAFNLLRKGDVRSESTRAQVSKYLSFAEGTFGDLRQPDNFSVAFSADADSPYRGRPHERVLTAMMLGIMDMVQGRYDMALPALKNAEFLDARWQPMPYGSDAPMVYALMYRCLKEIGASAQDVDRAHQGLLRSIRLLLMQEPLVQAANKSALANVRKNALAVRIAQLLMSAGLSSALVIAPDNASVFDVVKVAAKESANYIATLEQKFSDDFNDSIKPALAQAARVLGMSDKDFAQFSFAQVSKELNEFARQINLILKARPAQERSLTQLNKLAANVTSEIENAMVKPQVVLKFEGVGPRVVRSGEYNEIANIVKSPTGTIKSEIRTKNSSAFARCGLTNEGSTLTIVLCSKGANGAELHSAQGLELWSSSFQATSVVGRRFESILKGRAQFKGASESIAAVGGSVALALLNAASQDSQNSAALGGAALLVAGISGAVWLAGKAVNAEADPRFVPSIFESGYLLLP